MFRNASYGSIVSNQKLPPFHPSMHPAGSGFSRDPDSSPEHRSVWFLGLHACPVPRSATPGYIAGRNCPVSSSRRCVAKECRERVFARYRHVSPSIPLVNIGFLLSSLFSGQSLFLTGRLVLIPHRPNTEAFKWPSNLSC